jgi:glucose dehydrogenase
MVNVEDPTGGKRGVVAGWLGFLLLLTLFLDGPFALAADVEHTAVTDEMLLNTQADAKNWLTYGKNYSNTRYVTSKQINAQNVRTLVPRWVYQTGGPISSFETTPLVVDGVIYLTTPFNHAIAVDARTGQQLWRYEHKMSHTPIFCCGANNRGVAVAYGRVYMATLDASLVALDQKTGKVVWDVAVADPTASYSFTLAPLAYKGMIILGPSGAEYGIRGFVDAYDATDGKRLWRFWTIPETGWEGKWSPTTPEGEKLKRRIEKEQADFAKHKDAWQRGGGSVWMTPAVDPETDTLYVMVGNPSPDFDGEIRPGDNLYTESMVALDVKTGTYKWHYQYIPHDVWDLDAASPAVLFETTVDGRRVKAVGHAGKTGWFYIHDRATGKLIRKSEAFVPQENMFTPPTPEGIRMLPGANGGSEWSPVAYSPDTQMVYVSALHQPMLYTTHPAPHEKGRMWLGSAFSSMPTEEQWGLFSAIDVNTGKIAWQKKLPDPLIGGALATAGGVVFTGGDSTGNFYAFDAKMGKELWRFQCGAGVNAAPMSFEVDGEQFIAVAVGGSTQVRYRYGDTVFVFGLPKKP